MNFNELFDGVPYQIASGDLSRVLEADICRVATRAEQASRDALFVAVQTPVRDGHEEIDAAFAKGCRIFLAQRSVKVREDSVLLLCRDTAAVLGTLAGRAFGHPERALSLIGITGSVGKTSCAHMLTQVLEKVGRRVASLTSDGFYLDGEVTPSERIVPDAAVLYRMLADMRERGVEIAVLELSAYQLSFGIADTLPFLAVALTNLSPRHVGNGEFPDYDSYLAAKCRLLRADAAFAVLPVDTSVLTDARRVTVGRGGDVFSCDVQFHEWLYGVPSMRFSLCLGDERVPVLLPVPGREAVDNALLAAALAHVIGVSVGEIGEALAQVSVPGRLECVHASDRLIYIDSAYEATDLRTALSSLAGLARGRLCVLIGSVGGRAEWRRAELGVVCENADFTYFTADDPDAESPEEICRAMQSAMQEPERSCIVADRRRAIRLAVRELRAGDVLLIAGKGREQGQLISGSREPFDDASEACEALRIR